MANLSPTRQRSVKAAYAFQAPVANTAKDADRRGSVRDLLTANSHAAGSMKLKGILAISHKEPPTGDVQVLLVAHKLKPVMKKPVALKIRRGSLILPMQELRDHVHDIWTPWKECDFRVQDSGLLIRTTEDVAMAWNDYQVAEAARRRDILESVLESIRGALASDDTELHFQSCHALWELACDVSNHGYMSYSIFEILVDTLRSPELRVRSLAGATIWKLAESRPTLNRLPAGLYVPGLFAALLANHYKEPDAAVCKRMAETCALDCMKRGSVLFCEKIMPPASDDEDDDDDSDSDSSALHKAEQEARAVAGIGFSIVDQRVWHAGALLACLDDEAGKRAFHKLALRLLPIIEAPLQESPVQLKSACATLLSHAVTVATPVCKALLDGGAEALVRLAGGFVSGLNVAMRVQAAELLKFCMARVRLSAAKPSDQQLIDTMPRLIGELRAAMRPLMLTMHRYTVNPESVKPRAAEHACILIRCICGALWGLVSAVRFAHAQAQAPGEDGMDLSPRLPATPGMTTFMRKLLELAPERDGFDNEQTELLSKACGKSVRTFALGVIASLGFSSSHSPNEVSESIRREEEAGYDKACKRLGVVEREDDGIDPEETAAAYIQARIRGKALRSNTDSVPQLRRRRTMSRFNESATAPPNDEVCGLIQGRQLEALRLFAIELLDNLERSVNQSEQAATRATECYAAALCSVAATAVTSLLSAGAVDRLLTLCETMHHESDPEDGLMGYGLRIHGQLFGALLALVSHRHPSVQETAPGKGGGPLGSHGSLAAKSGLLLSTRDLERLVAQMQLSQTAGKLGAVILWLQACSSAGELVGQVGGTSALCTMLNRAVDEHSLEGSYAIQATWACAALWRLCFTPSNAVTCLEMATLSLLAATQQKEHSKLSATALGCVNIAMTGGSKGLFERLEKLGVASALRSLASSANFREADRVRATRTLNDVQSATESSPADESNTDEAESPKVGGAPSAPEDKSAQDGLMVSLLTDKSPELQATGCRGVARAAERGIEACRYLVSLDAAKHVVAALKMAAQPVLDAAATKHAEATYEEPASKVREYELLYDAVNAALNLSCFKVAQVPIARHGLWTLVELWFASQSFEWTGELQAIGEMASETLINLASNFANRNQLYQAELKLKTAVWSGGSLLSRSQSSSSLLAAAADAPDLIAEAPEEDEGEEGADSTPPAAAEPPAKSHTAKSAKRRYLQWLDDLDAVDQPEDIEAAALPDDAVGDVGDEPQALLLARAAFALMDANGDGELSRLEMIRAFRMDERVRELLLPMLPLPKGPNNSVTGHDLGDQVEAFEAFFKVLDADASDGITHTEFETFFKLIDTKKKDRTKSGAAARKRLLEGKAKASVPARKTSMAAGGRRPPSPPGADGARSALHGLMRKNMFDTWRKPIADQMVKREASRASTKTLDSVPSRASGRSLPRTPGSVASPVAGSPGLPAVSMRKTVSMPDLKPPPSRLNIKSAVLKMGLVSESTLEPAKPDEPSGPHNPWQPRVSTIEVTKPPLSKSLTTLDLKPFEKAYLAQNDAEKLRYKIALPAQEYKSRFAFTGKPLVKDEDKKKAGSLVSWVGVPGSAVGDSIAPSFSLPDGRVLRLFHESCKRNSRTPYPEPAENLPETLKGLSMHRLPERPPPPFPTERDVPKIGQIVELIAPFPAKTMLDMTYPPPSFGEIVKERFVVKVEERVPKPKPKPAPSKADKKAEKKAAKKAAKAGAPVAAPAADAEEEEEFVLENSIFAMRKKQSDGHSFYMSEQIMSRAFQIDWSRCNSPRFRQLIIKADNGGKLTAAIEVSEIRDALFEFHQIIYSTYTYYCARGESADSGDSYTMGMLEYFDLLRDAELVDTIYHEFRNPRALEAIFQAANEEGDHDRSFEQQELNRLNDDNALMRFEFMQVLVRVAIAKYVKDKSSRNHTGDVSDAVSELLSVDIVPHLPPEATRDPNIFRRKRLYTSDVHDLLLTYKLKLTIIYDFYSSLEAEETSLKATTPSLSISEFQTFLSDCNLVFEEGMDEVKCPIGLTPLQVRLTFVWSQSFVSDELKRRQQLMGATFIDFLEMLARICTFVSMPTTEMLQQNDAKSAKAFYDQIIEGKREWTGNGATLEDAWKAEEESDKPLVPDLKMLLDLIIDRLDTSGNGRIDRQELVQRRKRIVAEQKRMLTA